MTYGQKYRRGDFLRIDDRSGFRVLASKSKQEWTSRIVSTKLWEPRQPQDFVKGVRDQQAVPQPRPRQEPAFFLGTQPSFYVYNDANIGISFIAEDPTGPGPYYTPSFGNANWEVMPGNGNANTTIPMAPTVPSVSNFTTSVTLPVILNQPLGTITASNTPTSFAIVSGNPGYFGIDNTGLLFIADISVIVGPYTLIIQASNQFGPGPTGLATITVNPAVIPSDQLMDSQYVPSLG